VRGDFFGIALHQTRNPVKMEKENLVSFLKLFWPTFYFAGSQTALVKA